MALARLFEPGRISNKTIRNRIAMAPMGVGYADDPGGFVNRQCLAYYEARARGGAGLIIVGASLILRGTEPFPRLLGLYDDAHVPGLKALAACIKSHGATAAIQLYHAGRRLAEFRKDVEPVAPSAMVHPLSGVTFRAYTQDELHAFADAYGEAARRAWSAGFDGVEVHGAHGYLPNQFLSPWTNHRTDEYGGTVEKRTRFAQEIIKAIKARTPPEFFVSFRMDGYDGVDGGIDIDEASEQARFLALAGADVLHVSAGFREGHHWQFATRLQPPGLLTGLAARIRKAVHVPIITVGRLGDPVLAEQVLTEGKADFVAMGRPLIADPDLPNKAREGRLDQIRPCVYCNWGCLQLRHEPDPRTSYCSVNVSCGHEKDESARIQPARKSKKVFVVGAGLAGMEAAATLAERGHLVTLYEKTGSAGGQWNLAAVCSPEVGRLVRYLDGRLERAGVQKVFGQAVDRALVDREKPDCIVLATGARPARPIAEGLASPHVVTANDVLAGRVEAGRETVVVGGRMTGLDVAVFLGKKGTKVSVVSRGLIARDAPFGYKLAFKDLLVRYGVYCYPNTRLHSVTQRGVNVIADGEFMFLPADTVVLAVGSEPDNSLGLALENSEVEVIQIGDCVAPRNVFSAIHEGAAAGTRV